jgi:hypothetical protein
MCASVTDAARRLQHSGRMTIQPPRDPTDPEEQPPSIEPPSDPQREPPPTELPPTDEPVWAPGTDEPPLRTPRDPDVETEL